MGGRAKISFDHARGLPGARQAHFLGKIGKSFGPKRGHQSRKRAEKGPKEDERVGRGHFHERVGETPCTLAVSKRWTYHKTFFRY